MAFAVVFAGSPQGDALVEQAAVSDFGGFSDHHTHAVVDEHAGANAGSGMNFDASERTPYLADAAGKELERQAAAPQPMAEAVQADGVEARVAKQHLQPPTSSRVALANDGEIGSDLIKHRQGSAGGRRDLQADLFTE
jgi:hypothetical protein